MFSSDLSVASVMIKWKLKHLIQTFEQEYTFHIVGMRVFFNDIFFCILHRVVQQLLMCL